MNLPRLTAQEAANFIQNGDILAFGGFGPAGSPKSIVAAIAEKALTEHQACREFKLHLIPGSSIGDSCDGKLTRANAVISRIPFCVNKDMRKAYNDGRIKFTDLNLSDNATFMRQHLTGTPTWGIIEAADIEEANGKYRIYPTAATGIAPTISRLAQKGIFIELNHWHTLDRIGRPYMELEAERITGIVECNLPDESRVMLPPTDIQNELGNLVAEFIGRNIKQGVLHPGHLIFQSGVGSGANAVMGAMGRDKNIPDFSIYTEVFQDGPFELLQQGRVKAVSTGALTLSPDNLRKFYDNITSFKDKIVVRPSEISNCQEVISRLGVCAMNTALEVDIYGHVNSTKVCGTSMMNGVGGSLDYTTSAVLSIFTCGSTAKDGKISSIVPFCSHIDQCPAERADLLISIAHPDYRPILREYQRMSSQTGGQTPHMLTAAFALHDTYLRKGDMRLVDWKDYIIK